jgi:hypothetical protein
MVNTHCRAAEGKDAIWSFCPNIGAAYFWAIMFAFLVVAHTVQAIIHRKWYSIVIVLSALLQTAAFVCRVLSIKHYTSEILYSLWFVIILVAPIFTNAYVYMIMGRMVHSFLPNGKLFNIQARRFGLYFVLLDIMLVSLQPASN